MKKPRDVRTYPRFLGMDRMQILEYIRSVIPIVVQLKRDGQGRRVISEIFYKSV